MLLTLQSIRDIDIGYVDAQRLAASILPQARLLNKQFKNEIKFSVAACVDLQLSLGNPGP